MPKRSNEFQRLVHDIHRQLHETATVRESVLVPDRNNGPELEVDILIEDKSGEYPFTIGVECIDHKRRADINWVFQMSKKHENRTDKLVLVSRSGFSKNALNQAAQNGIITLHLSEAITIDWTEFVSRIRAVDVGVFSFKVEQGYVVLDTGNGIKAYKIAPELRFYEADGRPLLTANECANHILNHPDVSTYLMERIRAQPDLQWGRLENEMSREIVAEDASGGRHTVRAIRLDISWTAQFARMALNTNVLGNVPVAWGTADLRGEEFAFVATERKEKGFRATIRARTAEGGEPQLIDMKRYPETPLRYKIREVSEDDFL
jgi:hypothetical protein